MVDLTAALQKLSEMPSGDAKTVMIESLRNVFKSSLYKLSKYLLGYEDMTWHTHGDMCWALEQPEKRKLITMPRGTFKSSISVVAYSIFKLIHNPNLRILIDSEKYENSKNFIREFKGKVEDPVFEQFFGVWKSDLTWTEGSVIIRPRNQVKKEASLTASGVESGKTGQHFDIIIHDDLNTMENSETLEGRQKVLRHYKMNTSILDPGGEIVIVGTRYSINDVIGYVLQNEINILPNHE